MTATDRPDAPPYPVAGELGAAIGASGPVQGSAAKWSKRQKLSAAAITEDATCTPVLVRAVIVGRARMPRAALELTRPDGSLVGNVALVNTSAAFDPTERFWLVGDPTPGSPVALVSVGRRQVILPGSRLRAGPVEEPTWSAVATRLLGWSAPLGEQVPPTAVPTGAAPSLGHGWHEVLTGTTGSPRDPSFLRAVARFRFAAVVLPLLFVVVCFPYLFVIESLVSAGLTGPILLVLPLVGGGGVAVWSAITRRQLVDEAERIEPGAVRWGKEVAFTQSYWSGMRKPGEPWTGPLPHAAT